MPGKVVVVGSLNWDLTVLTSRLPAPGETVLGSGHFTGPGGKGANQAIAAARAGATVSMMGMVGNDEEGRQLKAMLEGEGVDINGVLTDRDAATGLAFITIDSKAENSIVVSPGANGQLSSHQLAIERIARAEVVLTQLEIPLPVVKFLSQTARGCFCLNAAPARSLPPELLKRVDVLVANRSELAALTDSPPPQTVEEAADLARSIDGPVSVVVTLGRDGTVVVDKGEVVTIEPIRVTSIDPTGAGDTFCGYVAAAIANGGSVVKAARQAVVAGALATTKKGAQSAIPHLDEVKARLEG